MSTYQTRRLILEILNRVEQHSSFLNILLPSFFIKYKPKDLDKALMQEISYGVVRYKKRLDWIIEQFLTAKKKRLPLTIQNILRIGAFQMLYLEKIPDYAIVNESVDLAKNSPFSGYSGLVNGLLRNLIRGSIDIRWPDQEQDTIKYISVFYSFPEWLITRWVNRFGSEICIKICQASNTRPDLTLRVNPLKISMSQFQERLAKLKVSFRESKYLPNLALITNGFSDLTNTAFFQSGMFSIQDESSMLVSQFLAPEPGDTVIDLCSGPGGKATHIAQIMENKGEVIAFEVNKRRLEMVSQQSARLGTEIISTVLNDSRKLNSKYLGKADKILVDAPCSGTGVIRKKPDLKWKEWSLEHLAELNLIQLSLLEGAAQYLKSGGELVYSTCSLEREENDELAWKFIKKHSDFVVLDSSQFVKKNGIVRYKTKITEAIQLIPGLSGDDIDGSYMIKMRKKS